MAFYSAVDFQPDSSVGYLAKRVHQLAQVGLEPALAELGLTFIQWHALVSIYFGRGATPAALARDLAYDKGATTRLLDGLDARGWVTRERTPDDRRLVELTLTEAGEAIARQGRLRVIDAWNRWLADWSDDDAAAAVAVLQRLRDTLQEKVR
jgi:DNA-binding MarR family transcriptional regulator